MPGGPSRPAENRSQRLILRGDALTLAFSPPFGDTLAQIRRSKADSLLVSTAEIAGRRISASCDDRSFFSEFFNMFGGPGPSAGITDPTADIRISIRTRVHPDLGYFHFADSSGTPFDGREFEFALAQETIFSRIDAAGDDWMTIAFRDSGSLAFAFHGNDCLFALDSPWRRSINWFTLWRLLRIESDTIFFHASAVAFGDTATIFIGPKGGGKSTTALALAARGHNLLSDEIAGYRPADGFVMPFRRPVGIKPGPRCTEVSRALQPETVAAIERDGFVRVSLESLLPAEAPRPYPLGRVVFLRGFKSKPDIARIDPGRSEIAELQPLMGSFLNASHSSRVFDLVRLLSATKVYRFHPGNPDETAEYLEEVFANE